MTAQEQGMLQDLTGRINGTTLTEKDSAAEQFLSQSLGPNPDATYIMAQTLLVQGYALEQAQKQLAQAKRQLAEAQQAATAAPKHEGSFLGNLLHLNDAPARTAAPPPPPAQGNAQYAPVQTYAPQQAQYGQPQYAAQPAQAGGGGFLGSAMRTATGVAAGALAFEGIESLMHGFGGGGMGGGYGMGGFGGMGGGREEIVNNYYGGGDGGREDQVGGGDLGRDAGSGFGDRLSADVEDRRDDSQGFADTSSTDGTGDDNFGANDDSSDDSSFDSGSSDDSSFDSGSSDDSSL